MSGCSGSTSGRMGSLPKWTGSRRTPNARRGKGGGSNPGAAGRAGQAAEGLQSGRIRDRIVYSKGVMRGNSPDYANQFEGRITQGLSDAADRLREAVGALGESTDDKRDRALEQARNLVRGWKSARERSGRVGQSGQQPGRRTGSGRRAGRLSSGVRTRAG